MIGIASAADGSQVREITARAGNFSEEEVACLQAIWQEYVDLGPAASGYSFLVDRAGERIRGYACCGPRDLASGVFDLYWIAVDPDARRCGVGRALLAASEAAARRAAGRMIVAETSGTPGYYATRRFYQDMGYTIEATIRDFYRAGDDLVIFIKRFLPE